MKITDIQSKPFHRLRFANVSSRGQVVTEQLPFLRGVLDFLPSALDCLIATADLQGRECCDDYSKPTKLVGEILAEEIQSMQKSGDLPEANRTAIILAGDFWARTEMTGRGGLGDVTPVWIALRRVSRWVVGVGGNHDAFGADLVGLNRAVFANAPGVHLLDGNDVTMGGLKIAGISGIVGNPERHLRREENDFADALGILAMDGPDILITHDGPEGPNPDCRGWPSARVALEAAHRTLVIRVHKHWDSPLATLANGTQVLNVDSRVVVLSRAN